MPGRNLTLTDTDRSAASTLQHLPRHPAQINLANLPAPRHGDFAIDAFPPKHKEILWCLVAAQRLPDPVLQLLVRRRLTVKLRYQSDKSSNNLAVFSVRDANDGGDFDGRMGGQPLLNLERVNILPSCGGCQLLRQYLAKSSKSVPRMIMSLNRPVIIQYPWSLKSASSPVLSHRFPSSSVINVSCVFASLFQ